MTDIILGFVICGVILACIMMMNFLSTLLKLIVSVLLSPVTFIQHLLSVDSNYTTTNEDVQENINKVTRTATQYLGEKTNNKYSNAANAYLARKHADKAVKNNKAYRHADGSVSPMNDDGSVDMTKHLN